MANNDAYTSVSAAGSGQANVSKAYDTNPANLLSPEKTDIAMGGFTVNGNGRSVGTTPEQAIKTTYGSDMKNMW